MSTTLEVDLRLDQTIALVGPPNSGKTTLYNWLTGSHFKTVNYPGATVEYSEGSVTPRYGKNLKFIDTPGTYSLLPKGPDEEVTFKVLFGKETPFKVEKVIVVCDGTQLERHLLLGAQLKRAGFSVVIALTMADLLKRSQVALDLKSLSLSLECPVIPIEGLSGNGVEDLVAALSQIPKSKTPETPSQVQLSEMNEGVKKLIQSLHRQAPQMRSLYQSTARADRILLHPVLGLVIFFLVMSAVFGSIFWLAKPFMDLIDQGFTIVSDFVLNLSPGSLWAEFIAKGIFASFGAVLVFVPQIFVLFWGVSFLEASGYLARAATLIDRPLSKLGMSGRSFVPILSGFACAVPAMMASRNITSSRDRWITNFIIPLMTCSARLPVFALLLSFLFFDEPAWKAGVIMAVIYFASLLVGASVALVLNRFLPRTQKSLFTMELPIYRRPRLAVVTRQSFVRTTAYIKRAGPVIFVFAVLLWLGTTFPDYKNPDAAQKLDSSYLGQTGKFIEPLFLPMGVDWRVGVGLLSAFAAREVFVSSMAIVFNVTSEDESTQQAGLLSEMKKAKFPDGAPIFTASSIAGLIVFFMIALQCMSTVAISVRESNSWQFALSQLLAFNLLAYVIAVLINQVPRFI